MTNFVKIQEIICKCADFLTDYEPGQEIDKNIYDELIKGFRDFGSLDLFDLPLNEYQAIRSTYEIHRILQIADDYNENLKDKTFQSNDEIDFLKTEYDLFLGRLYMAFGDEYDLLSEEGKNKIDQMTEETKVSAFDEKNIYHQELKKVLGDSQVKTDSFLNELSKNDPRRLDAFDDDFKKVVKRFMARYGGYEGNGIKIRKAFNGVCDIINGLKGYKYITENTVRKYFKDF